MISPQNEYNQPVNRRLDYENTDMMQIEALGRHHLKSSLTAVRYYPVVENKTELIMELFEGGEQIKGMQILTDMIKEFEVRIKELENKENGS